MREIQHKESVKRPTALTNMGLNVFYTINTIAKAPLSAEEDLSLKLLNDLFFGVNNWATDRDLLGAPAEAINAD